MKKIVSLIFCAVVFSACEKLEAEKVDFDVQAEAGVYHVGDPVNFNFLGNPDNITFYSGEDGSTYENRERVTVEGTPQLEFTSFMQYGAQQNTLKLLVSTDFNGLPDENIANNGTWVDITNRATLSTGKDNTPSGTIDLSEFIVADKPMYFAFRFQGTQGTTQRTWTIKDLKIENILTDGTILPVTTITDAGWQQISLLNSSYKWTNSPNTQLKIQGGPAASETNDDWIVTKPLKLSSVKPDAGLALKNITTRMNSFDYVYNVPGTYTVTFVASNVTSKNEKKVLKQIEIVIEP